jgi:uncharacterized protein
MYLAILSGSSLGQNFIRFTALMCNGLVTATSTVRFLRSGLLAIKPTAQLLAFSLPASIWSSTWQLQDSTYFLILGCCLMLAAVAMLVQKQNSIPYKSVIKNHWLHYPASAFLGLLAGITGIGGGVYLSPLLHLSNWASPRQIAATSASFILFNSVAAIISRLFVQDIHLEWNHLWLGLSVVLGGIIGSHFTISFLTEKMVRYFTILIIAVAAIRIIIKYYFI